MAIPLIISGIDFFWFLQAVVLKDKASGTLELLMVGPLQGREIVDGIIRWIVPLNLWHLGMFFFLLFISPGLINAMDPATNAVLILIIAAIWFIMLETSIISAFQHSAVLNGVVIFAVVIILIGILYTVSLFITVSMSGSLPFVNLFDNEISTRLKWLGIWFLMLAAVALGAWFLVIKTIELWRRRVLE